jgi:hypothetical protein
MVYVHRYMLHADLCYDTSGDKRVSAILATLGALLHLQSIYVKRASSNVRREIYLRRLAFGQLTVLALSPFSL